MVSSRRKLLTSMVMAAAATTALGGCKFFDLSNPFLPSARFYAQSNPSLAEVKYTFQQSSKTITVTEPDIKIDINSYPGDGTPGLMLTSYSAEYFDLDDNPIPSISLAKQNLEIGTYIKPAATGSPSTAQIKVPVYNQQVRQFGVNQAFNFAGGAGLNTNFSHSISCRVTLYGQDDNFNQISIPVSVPISFSANITQ